jgi:UMF1 family MFS transporter|tara:strand:+ start:1584 stop:3065 length:1482 start_codon:yes stop_codon:yes gene_type:complete
MTDTVAPAIAAQAVNDAQHFGTGGAKGKTGFAWAFFEWARNPYYVLIVIYIFAPYFAKEIIGADVRASGILDGLSPEEAQQTLNAKGQSAIAAVTKGAGLVAAFTAPFLGAALDRGGLRKPLLAIFLSIITCMSWMLWYAIPGESGLSTTTLTIVLMVAYVCYTYSEVTHNSMLTVAGAQKSLPAISGLGLGLGNLAAALLMLSLVLMFTLPAMNQWPFPEPLFGLDASKFEVQRLAGPLCAIFLAVFSIPFFLFAADGGTKGASWINAFRDGAKGVFKTIREAAHYMEMMKYLLARMLYADAMAAFLALGAVYVSLFLGWGILEMTVYAIFGSIWAFGGGLFGGWLDTKLGPKIALIIEIVVMVASLVLQLSITRETLFFGLVDNVLIWDGIIFQSLSDLVYLGSISIVAVTATASISSSRSMLVHLAPPGRSGEFFGLYAIAGTVTVWIGPMLVEFFTDTFNSQRIGMASIAMLFVIGVAVLTTVKMEKSG